MGRGQRCGVVDVWCVVLDRVSDLAVTVARKYNSTTPHTKDTRYRFQSDILSILYLFAFYLSCSYDVSYTPYTAPPLTTGSKTPPKYPAQNAHHTTGINTCCASDFHYPSPFRVTFPPAPSLPPNAIQTYDSASDEAPHRQASQSQDRASTSSPVPASHATGLLGHRCSSSPA